jgi:hypothetical protein
MTNRFSKVSIPSIFFISLLFLIVPATARTQTQQQNPPEIAIKVDTDLVVLDAQVMKKKTGRIIGGLKPKDFLLYEDKVVVRTRQGYYARRRDQAGYEQGKQPHAEKKQIAQ